jgi:hypothetical protein
MKIKRNIDFYKVINRTSINKERVNNVISFAEKFKNDPDKKERLDKQECLVCFYQDKRAGGAAMVDTECGYCKKPMTFSSTCVDVLCHDCAVKLGLCHHCGADINLENRRKLERK